MNTISNYSFYTYANIKKAETKNDEKDSTASQAKTEVKINATVADSASTSSTDGNYFMAKAYEEQNSSQVYIMLSAQPLNKTLTNYRDMYPNIIGFTAKTQSSLNSLCAEYKTKLFGLTSKFASCKSEEEFKKMVTELKSEIAKLMKEYEAKLNIISAITFALPALSDVRDKCVGTEIDMHDELEMILKGITAYSDKNADSGEKTSGKVGEKLDREAINTKMRNMESKNKEYKEKLKKAEDNKNEVEIEENQSLVTGSQKLIDVYSTVLKGFESLV